MGFEAAISALGLGDVLADDALLAQVGLMAVSTILFLCSIIVCGMAFRAAGAARRARREAVDLAVEVRHLTAQVEEATKRRAGGAVGQPAADLSGDDDGRSTQSDKTDETDQALESAKKAATVPSALLSSFVRRRS